jgi:pyrroloquinoline-quinone synthase
MNGKQFLEAVRKEIVTHPVMRHTVWNRFEYGRVSRAEVRRFSIYYYRHVLQTRLYDAMVLARAPFEEIQATLARILWDEYGRGDLPKTHPAQYRKLLYALDVSETEWEAAPPLPEFEAYTDVHTRLCHDYDVWVGIGVVGLAMEYPIPILYEKLVRGFRAVGVSDEVLQFFLEHMPTDEIHSTWMESAIRPYLDQEERQALVRFGIRRSMEARWVLMDGMARVTWPAGP